MVGFYDYTVILTYMSVVSAVLGLGFAAGGSPSKAVVCLMVCGFLDMFDGTVARTKKNRTDNEKKFGIQIDSMSDLIAFGVLPVMIAHSLGLHKWYEYMPIALYVLAALIRLAYYNVTEDELQITAGEKRVYYDGLPVTTVGLLIPFLYAFRPMLGESFHYWYLGWLLIIAVLFVVKVKIRKLDKKGMVAIVLLGLIMLAILVSRGQIRAYG